MMLLSQWLFVLPLDDRKRAPLRILSQQTALACSPTKLTPARLPKSFGLCYRPDELLTAFLKGAVAKSNIDPALIEDVTFGNTLNQGAGYVVRASMLAAGIPYTTPFQVVNRFCSSGLMAVSGIANRIRCGEITIGLAGGFENMSITYVVRSQTFQSSKVFGRASGAKLMMLTCGLLTQLDLMMARRKWKQRSCHVRRPSTLSRYVPIATSHLSISA